MELLRLIQEGTIGLCARLKKFDPHPTATSFHPLAYWWIRQGITRRLPEEPQRFGLPNPHHRNLNKLKKGSA